MQPLSSHLCRKPSIMWALEDVGMSVHIVWCAPAGLQDIPVKPQGQGLYTAEVCCRQAGLVTVLGKLNDRVIGRPETLPIKASTACKLQVTQKGPICCTAGLASCCLCKCATSSGFSVHLVVLGVAKCGLWAANMPNVDTPASIHNSQCFQACF